MFGTHAVPPEARTRRLIPERLWWSRGASMWAVRATMIVTCQPRNSSEGSSVRGIAALGQNLASPDSIGRSDHTSGTHHLIVKASANLRWQYVDCDAAPPGRAESTNESSDDFVTTSKKKRGFPGPRCSHDAHRRSRTPKRSARDPPNVHGHHHDLRDARRQTLKKNGIVSNVAASGTVHTPHMRVMTVTSIR